METAEKVSLSLSDLVRVCLKLPPEFALGTDARPVLVIDATSARKLARETRWWGYQYNQIAHALNRIAYYLQRDMADSADVFEELQAVEEKVERANADIAALRVEAQRMVAMFPVRK
ncbi:MAG: hypothetical protein Q4A93_04780 [Actinomycetota bacterium]|nr:hypothetical protein [Actinomycetota bacterium]